MNNDKNLHIRRAFAERLTSLRKANRHTQAYLAQKLNISKSCISNYENAVRMPETDVISAIADLYAVSMEYLLGSSKRPNHYVPEDKFIDKDRYLDLSMLSDEQKRSLKDYYAYLCQQK